MPVPARKHLFKFENDFYRNKISISQKPTNGMGGVMATIIKKLIISEKECQQVRGLLDEIIEIPAMKNQYAFMEKAALYAQELPRRIRQEFYNFKRSEDAAALLVSGSPVLGAGAGPSLSRYFELLCR